MNTIRFKKGDRVSIPWTEYNMKTRKYKKVPNLCGTIIRCRGMYDVKVHHNPKYRVLELYHNEMKLVS